MLDNSPGLRFQLWFPGPTVDQKST
jgi:hypothetical protein